MQRRFGTIAPLLPFEGGGVTSGAQIPLSRAEQCPFWNFCQAENLAATVHMNTSQKRTHTCPFNTILTHFLIPLLRTKKRKYSSSKEVSRKKKGKAELGENKGHLTKEYFCFYFYFLVAGRGSVVGVARTPVQSLAFTLPGITLRLASP